MVFKRKKTRRVEKKIQEEEGKGRGEKTRKAEEMALKRGIKERR